MAQTHSKAKQFRIAHPLLPLPAWEVSTVLYSCPVFQMFELHVSHGLNMLRIKLKVLPRRIRYMREGTADGVKIVIA